MPSQRSGLLALGGTLMAGTLVVAGFDTDAASSPVAGSCVDRDAKATACADPAAIYRVLTTVGAGAACPRGDYFERETGAGTLCLGYSVAAGDCVQDDPEGPSLVPCATGVQRPTIRIVEVVEGQASPKACGRSDRETVRAITYTEPATTLCIVHQPLASAR